MGKERKSRGKYIKAAPKKREKSTIKVLVGIIVILLVVVAALLWFARNWSKTVPDGTTQPQEQTESLVGEQDESNPTDAQGSPSEPSETDETSPTSGPSAPSENTATVVDVYFKEVNGELHRIVVLSDGSEIDEGPVDTTPEDESAVTYTVTFMNYDGTVLKKETVKSGGKATPPAAPTRDGYSFIGWSGSYSNVKADVTVVAQYQENAPEVVCYIVKFVDHDGTTLKTQSVEEGQAATAPADPTREGYNFIGWDKAFTKVTSNLTVTAQYEEIPSTDLTITVGNQTGAAGETVKVVVSLENNPGIVGMTLKLNFDESVMTLTAVDQGSALDEMTFTTPRNLASGCQLPWDAEFVTPEDASNGEILILTFKISDTAAAGNYAVSLSAVGDIIDNDLMPVIVVLKSGVITIN